MIQLVKVTNASNDTTSDADGFIQNVSGASVTYTVTPYGQYFPAGLVTSGSPSITRFRGTVPKEDQAGTETGLAVTAVTGNGTGAVVSAVFTDVSGEFPLTSIVPTTAGSGYLAGDILKITTAVGDAEFVVSEADNLTTATIVLGNGGSSAFPVRKYLVQGTTDRRTAVYRSVHIVPS